MATKADLLQAIGDLRAEMQDGSVAMIKWIVGTAVGLGVATITVMTFVLNYATPLRNQTPPVAPAPVIIQLPPYPTAPPAR